MNFVGKFDAGGSLHGEDFPGGGHLNSFTAKAHGHVPEGAYVVPDPNLIFHGEFKRAGVDLILSGGDQEFVLHDYFKGEKRAAIASPDGAHLTGDVVNALTGYVQYSQATPAPAAGQIIGHVTKLAGSAAAVRNGVSIVLNNGDNVEKGDVVSTGADSTLGITFIDGTVFGLASNARMVLNEMVYDPNGSNNSSLLSLVAGTITFVAGETAKHGDMKVDTPVATMGIRGTAVLTEISFIVPPATADNPQPQPQPQANFQVLVEPDGTTGSYILFDKITLLPIATVNQAGQMIQISGNNVSVSNALLSPDVQKLITDVFSLKFTDNSTNTKLTNFTDSITQDNNNGLFIKTAAGVVAIPTFVNTIPAETIPQGPQDRTTPPTRIPGPPTAVVIDSSGHPNTVFSLSELANTTGDSADLDTVVGRVNFADPNRGDQPTVKVNFASFTYQDASHQNVTAGLSALQKADIAATEVKIAVVADPGNTYIGTSAWTYSVPDNAFDFLAAGEVLTLHYTVRVDNNFVPDNETAFIPIAITVTGTNDKPVITTSVPTITFSGGTSVPGGSLKTSQPTSGTLSFADADLTDTHTVSKVLTSASLPGGTVPPGPLAIFENALSVALAADSTGTGAGTINWSLADLPVYVADFIPKSEVLTLTYTITVTDSQGTTATRTITVTITGTDAAAHVWIATDDKSPDKLWGTGTNWETGTVPTINDDAIIITDQLHGLTPSYPVTIGAAAFAKSLLMNDYDTTVGHKSPELINRSTLTIAGALTLSADSKLTNTSGSHISVGGAIDVEPTVTDAGTTANTSTITNAGTLTLAAGGVIDTLTAVANSGAIELSGGTLTLESDVTNTGGSFQVDGGATLVVDNATIDGGTVKVLGALKLEGTTVLKNGTLNNSGTTTAEGTVTFSRETVINTGTGKISVTGSLDLDGAEIGGGTLTISGKLVSTGVSTISNADINVVADDGVISVTGGTLTIDPAALRTITNDNVIEANGGSLVIAGVPIVNTGILQAVNGGSLSLDSLTVTNAAGTVSVGDGASRLYLSDATINGGNLGNAGRLYGGWGINTVTAAVTNRGLIEVLAGTLDLAGGLSGTGRLTIDSGATLELAGATAQAVTFAGGIGTLQLDDVARQTFTGTIAGQSSTGGTFRITGAGNIATTSGDALDFVASGSLSGSRADIALTPTGTLTGALNGIVVTQGGVGDISLTATRNITGLGGNGIVLRNSAIGSGNITVNNLTGTATGTGAGTSGVLVENFNAANSGKITITQRGGASGGAYGIDAVTRGNGDLSIEAAGNITGTTVYGIRARSYGAGSETVTTDPGSVITSGSSGIVAVNRATLLAASANSIITINAYGAINSGASLNQSGNAPAGIQTGYTGATSDTMANPAVNGTVIVNNHANITAAAGYGIDAFNYGNGDVTVNDAANTTIVGAARGINAAALSGGPGDVMVTLAANASVTGTSGVGIRAFSVDQGDVGVTMASGDGVTSGSTGIVAVNYATAIASSVDSTISVTAHGTIHAGASSNDDGTTSGGIIAGYKPGGIAAVSDQVHGDVRVDSDATITAAGGYGIEAFTWAIGDVTVTTGATSTITAAAGTAIAAFDNGGGNVSITNEGAATGAIGIDAHATGGGSITVDNYGDVTGTGTVGISAVQDGAGATGSTHITNAGVIVGASGHAAILIQENTTGTALIDNSGTIGPDAGVASALTLAVYETSGDITINNTGHITGNLVLAHATLNNESGGTWTVAGTSVFGSLSAIQNDGEIDLLNGAFVAGDGLHLANSSEIESWGTTLIAATIVNTGTIEIKDGTLTLFGSLTGSGSIAIEDGATLRLEGAVAQTVVFSGDHAELGIDTVSFGGSIAGLAATDKLDLSTVEYGFGTTATYVSNDAHTGGVLTVTDHDGHSINLTLVGDYSNANFAGSSDGHGGTLITLHANDDAPVLAAFHPEYASFTERASTTDAPISTTDPDPAATGTILFGDVDLTDRPVATITDQTVHWTDHGTDLSASLTQEETEALEQGLSLQQWGHNNGAIRWTYSIADSKLDFLGEGQTAEVASTITLDDGRGGTHTEQVTVWITGKNDAPTLTSADSLGGAHADLTETGGGLAAQGELVASDVDATDHVKVAVDHVDVYLDGTLSTEPVGGLSGATLLSYLSVPSNDVLTGNGTTHAQLTWDFDSHGQDFDFLAPGQTLSLQYSIIANDGHVDSAPELVTVNITAPPLIDTTHFTYVNNADNSETVSGLSVEGSSSATYTLTAVTAGAPGSSVTPSSVTGSLEHINSVLAAGGTYAPGDNPPDNETMTLTVSDDHGRSDTVNFIFREGGSGPVTLTGTAGKDLIFATDSNDTLAGNGGQDQFVFMQSYSSAMVQHTVDDFDVALDKIDVRQFVNINSWTNVGATQQGGDTLLTLDDHDSILLKNVLATSLHASDFIVTNHVVHA